MAIIDSGRQVPQRCLVSDSPPDSPWWKDKPAPEGGAAPTATSTATADAPPSASPSPSEPAAAPSGTAYDQVTKWKTEGVSREDAITRLKAQGHDDESAKVLVNSVMGAMPAELPSAQLTAGTNTLSPSVFSLSDIGLTGPSHVVGLYWMGFGAAILLALGLGTMMTVTEMVKINDDLAFYAVRLGGVASMACVAWGVFRYSQGIVIRRKP